MSYASLFLENLGRREQAGTRNRTSLLRYATHRKPASATVVVLRVQARRVEAQVVGVRGIVGTKRPIDAARTSAVKLRRVPAVVATPHIR